jgi:HEPN domain-containing protein
VGYYEDALEWEGTAIDLKTCYRYRGSVYMSCLAVECYLKSKVEILDPHNEKLQTHDSIYLYRFLKSKYPSGKDLLGDIKLCRKYHNDTRYSNSANCDLYDEAFATRFIKIVSDVREYINHDCAATMEDLQEKYKNINP